MLKFKESYKTDWLVEFQITECAYLSIADAHRATINGAKGAGITLSFQIDDVDRVHRLLKAHGVTASIIKNIWNARAFSIHDPEGHRIESWV